jgi:hypothetical protein
MSETAETELAALLERVDELGDGSNVYDRRTCESYMIAGGGPTAWVTFELEAGGEIRDAKLEHYWGGDESTAEVPEDAREHLLRRLRADWRTLERGRGWR